MRRRALSMLAAMAVLGVVASPVAACRVALALGLDVSGSVNQAEYRLQLDGVAAALEHPDVLAAIAAPSGGPVALAVYEWSGPAVQRLLVPWTLLPGPGDVAGVATRLRGTQRVASEPSTAIGAAMAFGAGLMSQAPRCGRAVIDISGDGKSNTGPHPRDMAVPAGITINALAIGGEIMDPGELRQVSLGELSGYFTAYVIRGPEAFVETARGFFDFEAAMVRKLLRELEVLAVSDAGSAARDPWGGRSVPRRRPMSRRQ